MKFSKVLKLTVIASLVPVVHAMAEQTPSSTFPKPGLRGDETTRLPHVGVLLGTATPEGAYRTAGELGIDVGYQPMVPFGVGAEYSFSSHTDDRDNRVDRSSLLIRGTYNFGGDRNIIKHSYVGVAAGPVFKSDGTGVALAPLLGADFPVQASEDRVVTLGAQARYLLMDGSDPDSLSVNASVKLWY